MKLQNREGDFLNIEMTMGELETICGILRAADIGVNSLDLVTDDLKPAGIKLCYERVESVWEAALKAK